jgi:hypothetical protein
MLTNSSTGLRNLSRFLYQKARQVAPRGELGVLHQRSNREKFCNNDYDKHDAIWLC